MCFDCDHLSRRSFLEAGSALAASAIMPDLVRSWQDPELLKDPRLQLAEVTYSNGSAEIKGFLARPRDAKRHSAMFIIHGDPGLPEWARVCAARLALVGYVGLVMDIGSDPVIQNRPGEYYGSSEFDQQVTGNARAGFRYLFDQPFVNGGRLGILGFCFGGRMAYLIPLEDPNVKVAVAFYGPVRDRVSRNATDPKPHVMEFVDRIAIPTQGHYGSLDTVAQEADAREFESLLHARGRPLEMFYYEGAGHGFYGNTWQEQTPQFGYNAAAANTAHERMLRFLKKHLE
jgi:carboxymethylenebutenolidase